MKSFLKFNGFALLASVISLVLPAVPSAQAGAGYAMSFNGTNNYVWINRPVSNDFTLEFWFNSTQVAGTNTQWWQGMGLVDGEVPGAYADFGVSLGAGTVVFGTGGAGDVSIRSGVVADGKWHHVAATRVRTNGLMQLYVDGALAASGTGSTVALTTPAQMRFGSLASGVNYYQGLLDEVKIWSVARTQGEIQAGMNREPNVTDTNLTGYWPFREGAVTVQTADASRHGYPARLVNRPGWVPSPVGWEPGLGLIGSKVLTNECHGAFVDPGAFVVAPAVGLDAGITHNLALMADGSVVGWGDNRSGETNVPSLTTRMVAVGAGEMYSVGLRGDGVVISWGDNSYGQTNTPVSATNVVSISAGRYHILALRGDGTVVGWGRNAYGQATMPAAVTNVVAISAGGSHSLVLMADGTVFAWGYNSAGQTNVPVAATNVVAISAGDFHSLALRGDGTVVVWGRNDYGQAVVPAAATNVVAITAGVFYNLALRGDGTVVGWGENGVSQAAGSAAWTNVMAISAGGGHSLGLRGDGTFFGWGWNEYRQTDIPAGARQVPFTGGVGGTLDLNTPGSYQLTYALTNLTGTVMTTNRTVVVADRTQPVISLLGDNPATVILGNAWNDPGASAVDACAGDISGSIVVEGLIIKDRPGRYSISYTITDPGGNIGSTNRTVNVVGLPVVGDLGLTVVATNTAMGTRTVELRAVVAPQHLGTEAGFEYGLDTNYAGRCAVVTVPYQLQTLSISNTLEGLAPGAIYHWRVVASNSLGVVASPDQVLEMPALYPLGDRNGDGVVDGSEFSAVLAKLHGSGVVSQTDLGLVLSNYWPNSGWLQMTNVAGLGGRSVTFALTNDLSGAFSVESSTDLINWSLLGPAVPRYPIFRS